jgi:hypothetical protein
MTLGQSLKNLGIARKDVVIATKVAVRVGQGRNDVGASRGHIMDSVEGSLRRLQTDYIDPVYATQDGARGSQRSFRSFALRCFAGLAILIFKSHRDSDSITEKFVLPGSFRQSPACFAGLASPARHLFGTTSVSYQRVDEKML